MGERAPEVTRADYRVRRGNNTEHIDGLPRAYALAEYLEYLCDVHLRALATGRPVRTLPAEEIARVAARINRA